MIRKQKPGEQGHMDKLTNINLQKQNDHPTLIFNITKVHQLHSFKPNDIQSI